MRAPEQSLPLTDIESLYSDHHGWLLGWLRRKLGCAHNAADLAQDTFVRVLGRPADLHGLREPRAWLTTIAQGLVIDQTRRRALERAYLDTLALLPEAEHPSPETQLQFIEALARIDAMLDGLNPRARTAFLLSRLEGLSYPEIAAQLQVSLSSVEKYMATAIRHCLALRLA
ncbi:MAG: sigma-70 family RNA polymerase sigma factor [Moraxellaceae bacterium]|nr:sigma-70 family RNA polymerase sigma factor [Moraxellaceae bacterium]